MPLHLLGKKSWNVYNADNIAKVKRDEAVAAAREQAREQHMQEVDAERRVQQLRGRTDGPLPAPDKEEESRVRDKEDGAGRERKRRRIAGEDDTDRDIRFAQEDNALIPKAEMQMKSQTSSDAPLTDSRGHIDLFPVVASAPKIVRNVGAQADKAKRGKEYEDQYTMRFSNAAGFKQVLGEKPWYHTTRNGEASEIQEPLKDVWGNEDPRREERQRSRLAADDPLAAIKKGVTGVREVKKERKKWIEEKDRETKELEEADRRRQRRERKRRRKREVDDLEGFSIGPPVHGESPKRHQSSSRDLSAQHSHRQRSRIGERSRHRSHHGHHKSLGAKERPGWEVGAGGRYSSQFAQG